MKAFDSEEEERRIVVSEPEEFLKICASIY